MHPLFHPSLINGPFSDPGLFIDFQFERRAILFDLGEISHMPARKLLRVSDVFVSHTHVDHFIGFDHLVRLNLGRDRTVRIFGPPGFISQVRHRLGGYTWNLVQKYPTDFTVVAAEIQPDGRLRSKEFHCREGFPDNGVETESVPPNGILLDEETFAVRWALLDHGIPVLAFALEEKSHVNVMKNRLDELGMKVGPWLGELKRALLTGENEEKPFRAWWKEGSGLVERWIPLGRLKHEIVRIVPGQKITYVTDTVYTPVNAGKIVDIARGSDYLFIEACFLDLEAEQAAEKRHLTARQAGKLAGEAGAARVTPFHFSPRYLESEHLIREELNREFLTER